MSDRTLSRVRGRVDISLLRNRIIEKVARDPRKAALILTEWLRASSEVPAARVKSKKTA